MIRAGAVALLLGCLTGFALFGTSLGRAGDDDPQPVETLETVGPGASVAPLPPHLGTAPGLVPVDGWLPASVTTFEQVSGSVTVVQFWAHDCVPCRATIPSLQRLLDEYGSLGVRVVTVHAPDPTSSDDAAVIAQAALDQGITWPIALDGDRAAFDAWQGNRRFWPRTYVIDAAGQIRYDHIGEGGADELAEAVASLLGVGP